jgi:hypothetical protein
VTADHPACTHAPATLTPTAATSPGRPQRLRPAQGPGDVEPGSIDHDALAAAGARRFVDTTDHPRLSGHIGVGIEAP